MPDRTRLLNQIVVGHLIVGLIALTGMYTHDGAMVLAAGLAWTAAYFGEGFVLSGHKRAATACYWASIVLPVAGALLFIANNPNWF